ncbi:SGNH/GDSL hydrolase family protein [Robinsoniella peoriensis]|uniref:SGNH/GDSL hydrolase family protein n=1 Tax=Robinsoniella peoriensis TaxID=180332 RepID=UPI003631A2FB
MAKFKGNRCIPTPEGKWDKAKEYLGLSVVLDEKTGDSYTSKKVVPAGTELTNKDYWALSGQYNAQMALIKLQLDAMQNIPEGGTTADAALENIRIGADGTEYATPGDAVRGQVGALSEEIADISMYDKRSVDIAYTFINNSFISNISGNVISNESCAYAEIDLSTVDIESVQVVGHSWYSIAVLMFKDVNGNIISSIPNTDQGNGVTIDQIVSIPDNAKKMLFTKYKAYAFSIEFFKMHKSPINADSLYRKKWTACGDSFTEGDFTGYTDKNGKTKKESDAYDTEMGMYKTYPWWIAKRNSVELVNEAKCGSYFTNVSGAENPFSVDRYKQVPKDSDYITIAFGLNETGIVPNSLGVKTDTKNTTLWGAYNVVFEYLMTNIPYARIGVIIMDAWMTNAYREAVKTICKSWGVPVLDLNDDNIPFQLGIRSNASEEVKSIRNQQYSVNYGTNNHPNLKAHEIRSAWIESWLKAL